MDIEISQSDQSIEQYYVEFLRCAKCLHYFEFENSLYHPITLPICCRTICRQCFDIIRNETNCPPNQISNEIKHTTSDQLITNYPLLLILCDPSKLPKDNEERYGECPLYMKLDNGTKLNFYHIEKLLCDISFVIKPIINDKQCQPIFNRSMIRNIFHLLNCQYIDHEGRLKVLKAIHRLGERICIDFILHHKSFRQVIADFRSTIGLPDDEFLESAMHENVLRSILLFFEYRSALSLEEIVISVSEVRGLHHRLLIQLEQNFQNYESLLNAYDVQFIRSAIVFGFNTSPEVWSKLLYGTEENELSMEFRGVSVPRSSAFRS
ncbi:unnamed protein product [Rotaria sordida]|uniref:Roquin II domain-containing protein n=1 Tax=Rotaria sordida TaxID=392033 RepID=A0A814AS49_9BILA|nr:unnamed protein product [Rotaria sordida]